MSDKPRKPRITTDATKAKLPKPKRKRPPNSAPKRETWAEGYAKWEAKAERAKRVQCPRCEKLLLAGPHDIHTCYDAKALREAEARAVPCGEDMPPVIAVDWPWGGTITGNVTRTDTPPYWADRIPPITEPFPWPVRVLNWLDEAPTQARRKLAAWLRALAGKVEP